jgi:hypothetical protein
MAIAPRPHRTQYATTKQQKGAGRPRSFLRAKFMDGRNGEKYAKNTLEHGILMCYNTITV